MQVEYSVTQPKTVSGPEITVGETFKDVFNGCLYLKILYGSTSNLGVNLETGRAYPIEQFTQVIPVTAKVIAENAE